MRKGLTNLNKFDTSPPHEFRDQFSIPKQAILKLA